MDVSATKLRIIEWVLSLSDEEQINELKMLSETQQDFGDNLTPIQKQFLSASKEEIENGKGIPHEKVRAGLKNKYSLK